MSTSLSQTLDVYEAAVAALDGAIDDSVSALDRQDSDALPGAIEAQQQRAESLQAVQAELKRLSVSLGYATLREAVSQHADSASLYPRYQNVQQQLRIIQQKLVSQAEAISRAMANNAELIALLTNAQPSGAYEENGHTSTTASNTLSARA
ncbi:MAG: flagellar export chaperone FlgN [Pseudomonadota bacterium]